MAKTRKTARGKRIADEAARNNPSSGNAVTKKTNGEERMGQMLKQLSAQEERGDQEGK